MVRTLSYIFVCRCFGVDFFLLQIWHMHTRKLRKERRKAMREAYYARERREAAYQASSICNFPFMFYVYFFTSCFVDEDAEWSATNFEVWLWFYIENKTPNLHSFTQISLPKECLNYSEEPWIGEVIYLSWPPFLDTSKKSWLFGFLWTVTISYNGQQCNQNVNLSRKSGVLVLEVKNYTKMKKSIVIRLF